MATTFQKATKKQARLRLALIGPAGSGKTFSALSIAAGLGERVALIDTERASASKYASEFSFDAAELDTFSPQKFIEAIGAAEAAGYDVLIIDSLSHAWMGKDGALEQVDNAAKRSKSGNSFTAWREVTPLHNALVDTILRCRCHVIATIRSKTEWVLEKDKDGKSTPRRIGLAPIQRDGLEFEFDVIGDLDAATLVVSKTRCRALHNAVVKEPGLEFAGTLKAWLTDGAVAPEVPRAEFALEEQAAPQRPPAASSGGPWPQVRALLEHAGVVGSEQFRFLKRVTGKAAPTSLTEEDVVKVREALGVQRAAG